MGILGGTFNPPHRGHLALARAAREQLGLPLVLLMPVHTPPHKIPAAAGVELASPEQRLRMCELAVAGEERLRACALEIERGGPSYTVDTLRALHDCQPDSRPTLILGSDVALSLPAWRDPRQLLDLARLAVAEREVAERGGDDGDEHGGAWRGVRERIGDEHGGAWRGGGEHGGAWRADGERAGDERARVRGAIDSIGAPTADVTFVEMPRIDISSSLVRERIAHGGDDLEGLVGSRVATYIAQHRLYGARSQPTGSSAEAIAP